MSASSAPKWLTLAAIVMGLVSGFLAGYFVFPIPDYKFAVGDAEVYINQADMAPLTAPLFYSIGMILLLLPVRPKQAPGHLLGVPLGIFIGWLLAVNIAVQIVTLAGQPGGSTGELVAWLIGGAVAGAVGATFTWLGARSAIPALSDPRAFRLAAAAGAFFGLLLYPAYNTFEQSWVLFAPWQAAVACTIAWSLARRVSS
jgi:hypothetical protein